MGTQSSKPRKTTIEQDEFTGNIQVSEGVARRLFQPRLQAPLPVHVKENIKHVQKTDSIKDTSSDTNVNKKSVEFIAAPEKVQPPKESEKLPPFEVPVTPVSVPQYVPSLSATEARSEQVSETLPSCSDSSATQSAIITPVIDTPVHKPSSETATTVTQKPPEPVFIGLKEEDVEKYVQTELNKEREIFQDKLRNQKSNYEHLLSSYQDQYENNIKDLRQQFNTDLKYELSKIPDAKPDSLKEEDVHKNIQSVLNKERQIFQDDLHAQKSFYEQLLSSLQSQYNNNLNEIKQQISNDLKNEISKIPEGKPTNLEDDVHYHLKLTTDKLKEKEALLEHVSNEKNMLFQQQKEMFEEMNETMQKAIVETTTKAEIEKNEEIQKLKELQVNEMEAYKSDINMNFSEKEKALQIKEQNKEEELKKMMNLKQEQLNEVLRHKEDLLTEQEKQRDIAWQLKEKEYNEMIKSQEIEREHSWNDYVKERETFMHEKEMEREAIFTKREMENEENRQKKVQLIKSDLENKINYYKERLHVADDQNKTLFESSENTLNQYIIETQKKFPKPVRTTICSDNASQVLQCLQTNIKKPLLCSAYVKAFSLCVQSQRTNSVKL